MASANACVFVHVRMTVCGFQEVVIVVLVSGTFLVLDAFSDCPVIKCLKHIIAQLFKNSISHESTGFT